MSRTYWQRVADYMADDLCGPVRWWEIFAALWVAFKEGRK